MSEAKHFGRVSFSGTYRSNEWKVLAKSISKAESNLNSVMNSLDAEELVKFYKVMTGQAYCATFEKVLSNTPLENSNRSSVKFNNAYVPDFVIGELQSFKTARPGESEKNSPVPLEEVMLTEWQVKRGYCYHLALINLSAAKDCAKKRNFSTAMTHLCQALMQIGAAATKDPAEIEKLFESKKNSDRGRANANARHNKPNGARQKAEKMRSEWATGKYDSRDRCAEEMCGALGMSLSSARKALRNTPDPT